MLGAIKSSIKSGLKGVRQGIVGKYATPRVAGTDSYYAAEEDRVLAEERASASLGAPPKSGISGLFAAAPRYPSVQNNPFYNPHAATAVNRNIKERTGAWLKGSNAPVGTIRTALENSPYLNKIREAARAKKLTTELQTNPTYLNRIRNMARKQTPGAGAAGGKRTRRRKTNRKHKRKTYKRRQ